MNTKVVELRNGKIQGKVVKLKTDQSVCVYRRIPFGKPPTGSLRFMPPQPAESWSGVIDGTKVGPRPMAFALYDELLAKCMPLPRQQGERPMSEDCLHLTVYSPLQKEPCSRKLPVMVMIYGGGFTVGSESDIDCSMLSGMNDVIVVVPNYRVSLFGFLSLGPNSPCTGNAGILDQQLSFRWVQENIEAFGGDKNNVTIFGESAGGMSVHFNMLSPTAKGLFHRAISQSGQGSSPFFFNTEERNKKVLELTLKHLEIEVSDKSQILAALQEIPAEKLTETQSILEQEKLQFNAMIDGKTFEKSPTQYLNDGDYAKIPYIMGHNSTEGAGTYLQFLGYSDSEMTEETARTGLPFSVTDEDWQTCKELYGTSKEGKNRFAKLTATILGDSMFVAPLAHDVKYHAETTAPLYVYVANFRLKMNHEDKYGKALAKRPDFCICDHGDDNYVTFGAPFYHGPQPLDVLYTKEEELLSIRWMKYLTNFAKTGDPNKGAKVDFLWPKYQTAGERLLFDHESKVVKNFRERESKFWMENTTKIFGS